MSAVTIASGPGLSDLASRINAEHDGATSSFNAGIEHALACGRLLIEAKGKIPHGAWLPWLEANCTVTPRMSQNYMRLAKETPRLGSNTKRVADFSVRQAIAAEADIAPASAEEVCAFFKSRPPSTAEVYASAAVTELANLLRQTLRGWIATHPAIASESICDTLNVVY